MDLERTGIPIARGTVAKYRNEINIMPSNMRKQYKGACRRGLAMIPPTTPQDSEARMRARRASPFKLALTFLLVLAALIGMLLAKYFSVRRNQGVPMIDGLRTESPYAFTKIVIRPAVSDGRLDSASLTPVAVEITDPDAIHEVMNAVERSELGDSTTSDDAVHWRCSLLFIARGHTWQCQAASTDQGVLLNFWSNGLSGWALGSLQSDALTDILPRAAKLTPPSS